MSSVITYLAVMAGVYAVALGLFLTFRAIKLI